MPTKDDLRVRRAGYDTSCGTNTPTNFSFTATLDDVVVYPTP